ncbi:general secretion pathway protein C [Ramlibacter terrae]|uniref:General secretion pathway protein C n=1 Tax=Ramlibacter terrae TaxID=2732511 RepID=A0ABX6P5Y9_9BURK|nr:general secretion pathway protein C [Ramlibacter terrae]
MVTPMPATWTVRGATFALWLLAAGCAAFWGLRLGSGPEVAAPLPAGPRAVAVDPAAIGRLLGGVPAAPGVAAAAPVVSLASRFQLVGVAAGASSGGGAAVISVDGAPAKPYRVGSVIEPGLVLQSVQGRRAVLATQPGGTPAVTLELPPFRK